jgi:aryl-alcohol dehydrogenase-like predicted oxidoreductase
MEPTRQGHADRGDDPNQRGNSRRWIMAEVENSLRRLQTDYQGCGIAWVVPPVEVIEQVHR